MVDLSLITTNHEPAASAASTAGVLVGFEEEDFVHHEGYHYTCWSITPLDCLLEWYSMVSQRRYVSSWQYLV